MLVTYVWCPEHGRRSTAILEPHGLRRCDAPVDGQPCRTVLTRPGGNAFDREVLLVRADWPGEAPDGH